MNERRGSCGGEMWRRLSAGLGVCLLFPLALVSAQDKDKPRPIAPKDPLITELLPLSNLDADQVPNTLKAMFGDPKRGGPYIEYYPQRNALVLRGSAEQLQEIKRVLLVLGERVDRAPTTRILTLERGSAATLAEALQKMLPQLRNNPVKVILPAKGSGAPAKPERPNKPRSGIKDPRRGKAEVPIILTAFGNRLLATSADAQALTLVVDLARLLQAPATDGDFEVVRLKHAQASNVARVLDEAFNGARRGGVPRSERVRVVADPATNSLLINASPLDTFTIRNLLTRALDIPEAKTNHADLSQGKKALTKTGKP